MSDGWTIDKAGRLILGRHLGGASLRLLLIWAALSALAATVFWIG